MLFRRLVWLALGIAVLVGSLQSVVQQWQAVPIILAAEQFEGQKVDAPPAAAAHDHAGQAAHSHDHDEWSPQDGFERHAWTWVANVLLAFGLALLMLAVLGVWVRYRGAPAHPLRAGLLVALAGFVSLYLWPSLGLPAEIPGMDAARLGSRQGWWLLAAGCAVAASASIAWAPRSWWRWLLALALLALPFGVGAPHVVGDPFAGFGADAAAQLRELASRFIPATAVTSVIQWLALGLLCGLAFDRWLLPKPAGNAAADAAEPTIASRVRG